MKALAVALLLFAACPASAQSPYSFMGFQTGQPEKQVRETLRHDNDFRNLTCKQKAAGIKICSSSSSSHKETMFLFSFVDNRLASFSYIFDHREYEGMLRSLTTKFGSSKYTWPVAMQNRMGASFTGVDKSWARGPFVLGTTEYFNKIDVSILTVSDSELYSKFKQREPSSDPKI